MVAVLPHHIEHSVKNGKLEVLQRFIFVMDKALGMKQTVVSRLESLLPLITKTQRGTIG